MGNAITEEKECWKTKTFIRVLAGVYCLAPMLVNLGKRQY